MSSFCLSDSHERNQSNAHLQSTPFQLNSQAEPSDALHRLRKDVNDLLEQHHASILHGVDELMSNHWSSVRQFQETSMPVSTHADVAHPLVHEPDRCKHNNADFIQLEKPILTHSKTYASIGDLAMAKGWMTTATNNAHHKTSQTGPVSLLRQQQKTDQASKMQQFLAGNMYKHMVGIIIVLNCIVLGIEADGLARSGRVTTWLEIANRGFVAIYALELGVRVCVQRRAILEDIYWTTFDALVVMLALVEICVSRVSSQATILRVIKILRLARTLRAVKAMHLLQDLRLMIESITHSARLLLWSVLLIFTLSYVFAIVFTLAIAHHQTSTQHKVPAIVRFQSSSVLMQVMAALFETLFGGTSWSEFSRPLGRISVVYEFLFMLFVVASNLVLLNVITGVVVQGAMSAAYKDRDLVIQEQFQLSNSMMQDLISLFDEADLESEGQLSRKELETFVNDERVAAFLKGLDVEISEAIGLFELLDSNGDGFVDVHEFTLGCMRLKGPAKNIDVATMLFEHKKILRSLRIEFSIINDGIESLKKLCNELCNERPHEATHKSGHAHNFLHPAQNLPFQGLSGAGQGCETVVQTDSGEPMQHVVVQI